MEGIDMGDMRGRHGNHARGPANGKWNDEGRMLNSDGYVKLRVGREHPLADPNGYAYEHLVVWVSAGRALPGPEELLHHKDEVKSNNRLTNLECITRVDHAKLHNVNRPRDTATGRFLGAVDVTA